MPLRLLGYVELPVHVKDGGFDHADVHAPSDRLYVAHTCNDALDVIDCAQDKYIESLPGLTGVAGALVSEPRCLVFTSNRGENTVSVFAPHNEHEAIKIPVGVKPNGLAFDPGRGILLAANVGNPGIPGSHTVSIIDVERRERIAEVPVPGRTRWTVYDPARERFYVNIASPAKIVTIDARSPSALVAEFDVPAAGPHGLDLDPGTSRIFCACDAGVLFTMDAGSGRVLGKVPLSGAPDVIFMHPSVGRLYAAIGEPGAIDVIDTGRMRRVETVPTESGSHTLALDRARSKVYAFLPASHRAAVFVDRD